MFKSRRTERTATLRGDETRDLLFEVALDLFRRRGFDETTMRGIAKRAGLAVGAAYYYFPSKETLIHEYWARVQSEHRHALASTKSTTLEKRIEHMLLEKLRIIEPDRALLGALFRFAGQPDHPLSPFGEAARDVREQAIETFALALEDVELPPSLAELAPRALWLMHMGLVLYAIYDDSPECRRSYRLARNAAALFCRLLRLAQIPGASVILDPALRMFSEAGL